MANMCYNHITIKAKTAKARKILRTAKRVATEEDIFVFDALHPDKVNCVEIFDEDVSDEELSLNGQSKWNPPVDDLEYLWSLGLSVCCDYEEESLGFCGRWKDGEHEQYEYLEMLPDGWEDLKIMDDDYKPFIILNNPVWEKGELIKLKGDDPNKSNEENKTCFGILLNYEPFEFILPDLPDVVKETANFGLDFLHLLDDLTMKKKVEILMTGESRPDSAVVYVDKNGNNYLHIT